MKANLYSILERIRDAATRCGRDPESVRLVAVSKTIPVEKVRKAIDAGVRILGENYIQEAREKFNLLYDCDVRWHFVGHLQRNKAKYAVRMFDLIHSVDSFRLARELDLSAKKQNKVQKILIQVNISQEETKSGVAADALLDLVRQIGQLDNIAVKGLMTMPPYFNAPERVRPFFKELNRLRLQIEAESIPGIEMTELSMGMTGDFEVAVEEGATLVRIGTAIFGARK